MTAQKHKSKNEAVRWFVKLSSGTATKDDFQNWLSWKHANSTNLQAWNAVEGINGSFKQLTPETVESFETVVSSKRRNFIKHIAAITGIVTLGSLLAHQTDPTLLLADYKTSVGERKRIVLVEGSILHLNSDTAIDIEFSETERTIVLHQGEVFLESAPDSHISPRPLSIRTAHGSAIALGTRYCVRVLDNFSKVSVFQDAVKIVTASKLSDHVKEGEYVEFDREHIIRSGKADYKEEAWLNGYLAVNDMRLDEVLDELSRYRSGYLKAEQNVASIKISGSFPLDDAETTLKSICKTHNLKLKTFTKYWVTVQN